MNQGDREGRPYNTTDGIGESAYCRGDPRGRLLWFVLPSCAIIKTANSPLRAENTGVCSAAKGVSLEEGA